MTWRVTIPFKGAPRSKSRLAERFDDATRHALALAFLRDTVAAVRSTPGVDAVVIVSNEPGLAVLLAHEEPSPGGGPLAAVEIVPDPGDGLNGAIAAGIRSARAGDAEAHIAALLGDLPELTAGELSAALGAAASHPLAAVTDASGTGTTLITIAPTVEATPRFGAGSAAAHAAAGFTRLELAASSGLRRDVDAPADVDGLVSPGVHTRAALRKGGDSGRRAGREAS